MAVRESRVVVEQASGHDQMACDGSGGTTTQRAELGADLVVQLAPGDLRIGRRSARDSSRSPAARLSRGCRSWVEAVPRRAAGPYRSPWRVPRSTWRARSGCGPRRAGLRRSRPSPLGRSFSRSSGIDTPGNRGPGASSRHNARRATPPSWWVALRVHVCVRRRPTLPPRLQGSTIGAERLSFRVRNGTGRFPLAMAAGTLLRCGVVPDRISGTAQWTQQIECRSSPRPISTGQLHVLPRFHVRPINPVV